jgi:hypothetical protein
VNLAEALAAKVEVHRIGACVAPRDVEAAILERHTVGRALLDSE